MAFKNGIIDLRSDTLTQPTPEMRQAMYDAEVGDDYYRDDATVIKLEEKAAELFDREAALLVFSGTLGNSVSILAQTQSAREIITQAEAFLWRCQATNLAAIARISMQLVPGEKGILDPKRLHLYLRGEYIDEPRTSLISIETPNNGAGGTIIPPENIAAISKFSKDHKLGFHIDGARIFNAVVELNISPAAYINGATSVMFCLSKGLCCPQCSMIVGSQELIEEARRWRITLGGHLRQGGILAAPGLIALDSMIDRLKEDNDNARYLAEVLHKDGLMEIDLDTVQTNMVRGSFHPICTDGVGLGEYLSERGIKAGIAPDGSSRLVTHFWVSKEDIDKFILALKKYAQG